MIEPYLSTDSDFNISADA